MRLHNDKPMPVSVARQDPLGVTLVEVLASIAILGVLLALLLPAIANSRRAAAALQCRTRMAQVGRATHNFEERNRRYPDGAYSLDWHVELLPDLDRSDLCRQLKDAEESSDGFRLQEVLRGSSVPALQCPSDPGSVKWKWAINFSKNGGSMFLAYEEIPGESHGLILGPLSSRDITDGLSMTAYVSEQMNEFRVNSTDRRAVWQTPIYYGSPNQLDLFADLCESMPNGAVDRPRTKIGRGPLNFIQGLERYDHIVRPNHATCLNGPADFRFASFTANSLHAGGAHVLMADGAVRFVNDNVGRVVWRAMGTRNGNETITLP